MLFRSEYFQIGTVDVANESVFVDEFSDVTQRPWRYKLSVVDDCGVESDLSDKHKTMHLTIRSEERRVGKECRSRW